MSRRPPTFLWSGYPCRGGERFQGDTPEQLLLAGLEALDKLMGRSPKQVSLSVEVGPRQTEYELTEPAAANMEQVAEWLDHEATRLLAHARQLNQAAYTKGRAR